MPCNVGLSRYRLGKVHMTRRPPVIQLSNPVLLRTRMIVTEVAEQSVVHQKTLFHVCIPNPQSIAGTDLLQVLRLEHIRPFQEDVIQARTNSMLEAPLTYLNRSHRLDRRLSQVCFYSNPYWIPACVQSRAGSRSIMRRPAVCRPRPFCS